MGVVTTLPAPSGGWNSTYPVTNLAPDEAVLLDNFIPNTGVLQTRLGSLLYVDLTTIGVNNIGGIYEFQANMVNKFIASGGGSFIDITIPTAPVFLQHNLSNDYWSYTIYGGNANSVIIFVNGSDTPLYWDGIYPIMLPMGLTGPGLDQRNLIDCFNYKSRVWFVEANSQNAWYGPIDAILGPQTLTKFYLGNLASFGGNLVTIKSLTADGGSGRQEFLCFYMSSGEIIIYQGDDPANADTFNLVGIYRSGKPVNTSRGVCKFGADLVAVTDSGYLPISSLLPYSFGKSNDPLSEKIRGAAISAVNANFQAENWQIMLVQNLGLLLVNVPTTTAGIVNQHVLNTNTLAWCSFSNMNANCWAMYRNNLYFGDGNGMVWQYTGGSDYAQPTNNDYGTPIVMSYTSAYVFDQPTGLKQSTAFRPRLLVQANTTMLVSASPDFKTYTLPYNVVSEYSGLLWGAPPTNVNVLIPTNNPLSTTINSNVVVVTLPVAMPIQTGQYITISGATNFNNLSAAQLNSTYPVTRISGTQFSYRVSSNANATGAGGGNAVNYTPYSPGPAVILQPYNQNQNYFGINDPNFLPVPPDPIPWARIPTTFDLALAPGPLSIVNGSNVLTITVPNSAIFLNGQFVTISGANTASIGGILNSQVNITASCTIVDGTHISINMPGPASTATSALGGGNVSLSYTYVPGPGVLPNIPGSAANIPYFGPDDPGNNPPGGVAWASDMTTSLGYLNLNFIFYSLSIKLVFTSSLQVNYYETDFLIKSAVRV